MEIHIAYVNAQNNEKYNTIKPRTTLFTNVYRDLYHCATGSCKIPSIDIQLLNETLI